MAYTEAQWVKLQSTFPRDERMSYAQYLATLSPAERRSVLEATPTTVTTVDESAKVAGAKTDTAAQKTATATALQQAAAQAAVAALTSGRPLTDAQKALLDIKTTSTTTAADLQKIVATLGAGGKLTSEQAAAINSKVDGTPTGNVTGTPVVTQTSGEPPNKPGNAWVVSADGKGWVIPPKPTDGKTYTWDDNKGWVAGTATKDPGKAPGAAWILNADKTEWIKPPQPNPTDTWDDEKGWIAAAGAKDEYTTVNGVLMFKGAPFTGTYNGKEYVNGKLKTDGDNGDKKIKNPGYWTDPNTGLLYKDDVLFSGDLNTFKYVNGRVVGNAGSSEDKNAEALKYAADLAAKSEADRIKSERLSAWSVLKAEFDKYDLGDLVDSVKDLILGGKPVAQVTMELRKSKAYEKRFYGNKMRLDAGLNVYDEGTYLDLENAMAEIFVSYGQKELMGSTRAQQQATFAKYIGGTISPVELKRRMDISTGLAKSDNNTIKAIKELYPMIGDKDIVAYFLNPEETLPKLETKAQAASIGGAFLQQGLKINTASMEEYAALGITKEEAKLGATQIASVLPRASQLMSLENGTYTQQQAEDVYLRQSATAKKELEGISKRETGRFSGTSGTSKVSLKSQSRNII